MNFQPNDLFFTMAETFQNRVSEDSKAIVVNEGGSRSSKTWDAFHFIVSFCDTNRDNPQDIYILRDTLVNCRDFTMKEFIDCLKTIGIYHDRDLVQSPKPVYKLFGHKIKFRGMDDEQASEGYPSDILFFNEALEMNKSGMDGLIMRCRKMVIIDFNPKYSDHFIFNMAKRSDTIFTHSTYKNNRHLQASVIKEIESYNPAMPENLTNGTADKYRWEVYGLGMRSNRQGLVFPEVQWVDSIPTKTVKIAGKDTVVEDVDHISYGMDFGKTAQTAIVKCAVRVRHPKSDLYLQKLFYAPTETSDIVNQILDSLKICNNQQNVWCDNNLPGWISDLRAKDKFVLPTKKFPGSREYWITSIKKFNIHLVRDIDFRKEQENFCYRVVDGKQLSETIKAFDHLWSAAGYSVVGDLRDLIETSDNKK